MQISSVVIAREENMSRVSDLLIQKQVAAQSDQELAESYLELQKLREQVRVAVCGRAIKSSASRDFVKKSTVTSILG
jgi:hypothetical protein